MQATGSSWVHNICRQTISHDMISSDASHFSEGNNSSHKCERVHGMAVLPLANSALAPMLLRRPPLRSGLAARPRLSHRPGLFLGRPTSVAVYARGGGSGRGRDGGRSPSPSGRGGRGGPSGPPPPRWQGTPLDIFGRLNLKAQPKTVRGGVAAQDPWRVRSVLVPLACDKRQVPGHACSWTALNARRTLAQARLASPPPC